MPLFTKCLSIYLQRKGKCDDAINCTTNVDIVKHKTSFTIIDKLKQSEAAFELFTNCDNLNDKVYVLKHALIKKVF